MQSHMADHEVCVVTHPLSGASETATRTLLDVVAVGRTDFD